MDLSARWSSRGRRGSGEGPAPAPGPPPGFGRRPTPRQRMPSQRPPAKARQPNAQRVEGVRDEGAGSATASMPVAWGIPSAILQAQQLESKVAAAEVDDAHRHEFASTSAAMSRGRPVARQALGASSDESDRTLSLTRSPPHGIGGPCEVMQVRDETSSPHQIAGASWRPRLAGEGSDVFAPVEVVANASGDALPDVSGMLPLTALAEQALRERENFKDDIKTGSSEGHCDQDLVFLEIESVEESTEVSCIWSWRSSICCCGRRGHESRCTMERAGVTIQFVAESV